MSVVLGDCLGSSIVVCVNVIMKLLVVVVLIRKLWCDGEIGVLVVGLW